MLCIQRRVHSYHLYPCRTACCAISIHCLPASPAAQLLGPENKITAMDAAAKTLTLTDGRKLQYDSLISTMPLDITLTWLGKKDWADGLTHRCARVINQRAGLGLARNAVAHAEHRLPGIKTCYTQPASWYYNGLSPGFVSSLSAVLAPAQLVAHHRAGHPRPQPARHQVLAVLPRGRLPLLPYHGVQPLRAEELPHQGQEAAHPVPGVHLFFPHQVAGACGHDSFYLPVCCTVCKLPSARPVILVMLLPRHDSLLELWRLAAVQCRH